MEFYKMSGVHEQVTKVFISHATEDYSAALNLKRSLEVHGISCWCFEEDLPHGGHISGDVKRAINNADFFIIFLSEHSFSSEWVRRELGCAREIHLRKGIGSRPIIIPVTQSAFHGLSADFQPIGFDTLQPLGEPIRFAEHNCFVISDAAPFGSLVRQLLPRMTHITEPNGIHADLFRATFRLWQRLFPDGGDVPDELDVVNWLEAQFAAGQSCPWSDTLLTIHYGTEVTAFVYMSFFTNGKHGYGTFIGIDPDWRPTTTFRWVAKRTIEELAASQPECQGIFFDVEEVDVLGIEEAAKQDFQGVSAEWIQTQRERLLRINHFTINGARVLMSGEYPAAIIQPCLREPLEVANERRHFMMYWPAKPGSFPSNIQSLIDLYYHGYMIGFGPEGACIPGYERHLDDVLSRTMGNIAKDCQFGRFYNGPAIRKIMNMNRQLP